MDLAVSRAEFDPDVMSKKCWRLLHSFHSANLKLSLFLCIVAIAIGEVGCFFWAFFTWRIPLPSEDIDSLNLLLVADSQIQGFWNEPPGIIGYTSRLDADWYLWKVFRLLMIAFSPDAVIHLGDLFDEGNIATDEEFLLYKARHDRIFTVPEGVSKIQVAGDNDVGGEGDDRMTQKLISRFSHFFGSVNEVIELKSFQIVKVNSLILQRSKPRLEEWTVYNETLAFIKELPLRLDKDKSTILIEHSALNMINKEIASKLIDVVQPRYAFSGHSHKSASFQHPMGSVTVTEYVVPTCSYRMGTNKMGAAIAVLGVNGSIDYSLLSLPTRYTYFNIYLYVLVYCMVLRLPFLIRIIAKIYYKLTARKYGIYKIATFL